MRSVAKLLRCSPFSRKRQLVWLVQFLELFPHAQHSRNCFHIHLQMAVHGGRSNTSSLARLCPARYTCLAHETLFTGDIVYGRLNCHDVVVFRHGDSERVGLIQGILASPSSAFPSTFRAFLIRLLRPVPPEHGKKAVVEVFGHVRYSYDLSATRYHTTVLIDATEFLRSIMIVPDLYWMKSRYGENTKFQDLRYDPQTLSEIKFF